MSKNNRNIFENPTTALPAVIKDAEVVPVEVSVNTVMSKGMAEALATANAAAQEMLYTALDRFAATSPDMASKISRITMVRTFTVVPDTVRLDIEVK